MKLIIPMAGRGTRLRPHTVTIPKPLIPIAGKPIVHRLVEDITKVCSEKVDEVAFIIGDFGPEVEEQLINIAHEIGAVGTICYQKEAMGTAHAILCAEQALKGKVIVAFADTLFSAKFTLDDDKEGIIWVHEVKDPTAFGVVKVDSNDMITDFVEKPKHFVSNNAIIGIYYFKDGNNLKNELRYLVDNDIKEKGEFQLTNALENMKNKNIAFYPGKVVEWLDCGNKNATVYTNQRILNFAGNNSTSKSLKMQNSSIIEPCYIGKNVEIQNSTIGPYVSLGDNSLVKDSVIENCLIQSHAEIFSSNLKNAMFGNYVTFKGNSNDASLGDYSSMIQQD